MNAKIKNALPLLAVAFIFFVLLASPIKVSAEAFMIPSPNDIGSTAMDFIEEMSGPMLEEMVNTIKEYALALARLLGSGMLLQWVIDKPIDIRDNALVNAGWAFTSSLANLFFVLALLFIAFAKILGLGDYPLQKTLPKLIISILLVNFGLVFIGMGLDIAWMVQKSILPPGSNLVWSSLAAITGNIWLALAKYGAIILSACLVAFIPVVNAVWQVGKVGLYMSTLPSMAMTQADIFVANSLAGIYFLYFLLFLVRIYAIQILAIFSPIAFACYAMPFKQAQEVWNKWLKYLLEFIFLGIPLLFFLSLGLQGLSFMNGAGEFNNMLIPSWIPFGDSINKTISYYICLIGFLGVAAFISSKFTPSAVGQAMAVGSPVGKAMMTRLSSSLGAAKKSAVGIATQERNLEKQAVQSGNKGPGAADRGAVKAIDWAMRASNIAGVVLDKDKGLSDIAGKTNFERELSKQVSKDNKAIKEKFGEDAQEAVQSFDRKSAGASGGLAMGNYLKSTKDPDERKKAIEKLGFEDAKHMINLYQNENRFDLADMISLPYLDKHTPAELGVNKLDRIPSKEATDLAKEGIDTEGKRIFNSLEAENVKLLPEDITPAMMKDLFNSVNNAETLAAMFKNRGKKFINDYINEMANMINTQPSTVFDNWAKKNSAVFIYIHSNAAQNIGVKSPLGITEKEARDFVRQR